MTRQDAKANGIQTVWVLRMVWADKPAQHLRDFRYGSLSPWSADVREAEIFIREVDADEMARRISWLLRLPVEMVQSPVDPDETPAATDCMGGPRDYSRPGQGLDGGVVHTPNKMPSMKCADGTYWDDLRGYRWPSPVFVDKAVMDNNAAYADRPVKMPMECAIGTCWMTAVQGSRWCSYHQPIPAEAAIPHCTECGDGICTTGRSDRNALGAVTCQLDAVRDDGGNISGVATRF